MNEAHQLVNLLERATRHFLDIGDGSLWDTKWSTGNEVAEFLQKSMTALRAGQLDRKDLDELWLIFAVTCTWDDNGGDAETGNAIFELLDRMRLASEHS